MAAFLNDDLTRQVKEVFAGLKNPVEVLFFGRQTDCDFCPDSLKLLEEVTGLSDQFSLSIYDLDENASLAQQYKIDRAPGFVIAAREGDQLVDYGIRFFGIPSGYEFTSLVNDLVMVSSRNSALTDQTRAYLKTLNQPVHLQVFVTPTCPYCPRAVVLAHQMAMESPWVEAEMVEASEFFDLANQFNVSGVPHTVINHGAGSLVGAAPEEMLVQEIEKVLADSVLEQGGVSS
jgi:glutaredoxin-like protein